MSENHESKLVNLNEPDKPAIGVVYAIMILTIGFLVVTFCGLHSFQSVMNDKAETAIEQEPTVKLRSKADQAAYEAEQAKYKADAEKLKAVEAAIESK